jgi:pimeloyl-ACP methyl ester carboxylesterase
VPLAPPATQPLPAEQAPTVDSAEFTGDPVDDPAFSKWADQPINWGGCESNLMCATIQAPLDWSDPSAGSIELALIMHPATGQQIGSLITNPGGPGASGLEFIRQGVDSFGTPVKDAFNIIGFDPRGVGDSTAVVCMDDADKDAFLSADYPDDDEGLAEAKAAIAAWGSACAENTGPLLGTIDTISAAKDIDLIRHLVGDEQLFYLGFSYGTQLGAAYAGLFPHRVGRMVLDGGIDITLNPDETSKGQAVGFENALRAYILDCQLNTVCPLTGTLQDGLATITDIFQRAFEGQIPTSSGRELTRTLAFFGVAVALYDHASWSFLSLALGEVLNEGTGDWLLFLADFYNRRNEDGSFRGNMAEAIKAISCLDGRANPDPVFMDAEAQEIIAAAPTVGFFFTHGGIGCWEWPYDVVVGNYDITAPGAAPILVIGTTGDPATPYEWSVALADTLQSGVLLTFDGEGHTAYGRSNACIGDAVDGFLVSGVVPPDNTFC